MIKRDRCRDTPWHCLGFTARSSDRDLVRGLHQGQRTYAPRQLAGHMTAPRKDQRQLKSILAQPELSTHDSAATDPTALVYTALSFRYLPQKRLSNGQLFDFSMLL